MQSIAIEIAPLRYIILLTLIEKNIESKETSQIYM